jgi:hypothetical protein
MDNEWEKDEAQKVFLQSHLQLYIKALKGGNTESFLALFYKEWFIRWPEHETLHSPTYSSQILVILDGISRISRIQWTFL